MIERGGEVVIRMLANVQQQTIEPLIKATIAVGSLVYTDEYGIYNALNEWGYEHKTIQAVNYPLISIDCENSPNGAGANVSRSQV